MFTNPQPRMPPEFLAADACVNFWENRSVIVILSMQATRVTHGGGRGREEGPLGTVPHQRAPLSRATHRARPCPTTSTRGRQLSSTRSIHITLVITIS